MKKIEKKSIHILLTKLITFAILVSMFSLTSNLSAEEQSKPEKAYRLTVTYNNGKMDSLIIDSLFMIIPLTVKEQIIKDKEYPKNYFYEMLDDTGILVLRSNMSDPTVTLLEYEDPESPGRILGKLVKHDKITFSIVVPAPVKVQTIRFARIIPGQDSITVSKRSHEVLGSFNLNQD